MKLTCLFHKQHKRLMCTICPYSGTETVEGQDSRACFFSCFPHSFTWVFFTCSLSPILTWVSPGPRVLYFPFHLLGLWMVAILWCTGAEDFLLWQAGLDLSTWSFFSSWHNKASSSSFSGKTRACPPQRLKEKTFSVSTNLSSYLR